MAEHIGTTLAVIGLLGLAAQWLAWWLKLPAILFLLLIGIVAGPLTGLIQPDVLFGDLLFPLVSLGVAVILFEGSLTLKLHEIIGHGSVVRNLITIGAVFTWIIIALAAHALLDLSWEVAFLFGALVSVTGPTVIAPLLRSVRPKANLAHILRWEGILIDPIGALLAVLVYEFLVSGRESHTAWVFARIVSVGGLTGAAGAWMLAFALRRYLIPDYLRNVASLVLVLSVFTAANTLVPESGLFAVTVMGLWLANMRDIHMEDILNFKESISVLLISALFIVLAARTELAQFQDLGRAGLGLLAVVLLVARPVSVLVSTMYSRLTWRERALLAWIAPRGIVAAAVSSLFALKLEDLGYPQAELLTPLTFLVIVGTVVVQGATARPLANWLGVSEPDSRGVLIVGANRVARAVGRALAGRGFRVLLTDTSWENIRAARGEGLDTYFGEVISEHADQHLDLIGIGRLFAVSERASTNALACLHYRPEFGAAAIFALETPEEKEAPEDWTLSASYRGRHLFGKDVSYVTLLQLLEEGWTIRGTSLTKSYNFDAYCRDRSESAIPLFALDGKGRLHVFTPERPLRLEAGWTVYSLLPPESTGQGSPEGRAA